MQPYQKGNLGEIAVIKELLKQGYSVFQEVGTGSRIDLIAVGTSAVPYKIQVKYCTTVAGAASLYLRKTSLNRKYSFHYKETDVDVFALYVADKDIVLFIGATEAFDGKLQRNCITFRFEPAKNGHKDGRDYKKYLLF